MKKTLMILLGIALILSMVGASSAISVEQTLSPGGSSHYAPVTADPVYVTYSTENVISYTVVVPADMTFSQSTATGNVVVSDVLLASNDVFNMTVVSEHGWNLMTHDAQGRPIEGHSIPYTMEVNDELKSVADSTAPVSVINKINDGYDDIAGTYALLFTMIDDATATGTYRDALTFTVQIDPAQSTTTT